MRDSRSHGLLLRTFLVCGLLYCMYLVTRQAIASWYFRKKLPQDIQTAIKWDPENPQYYDALATLTHLYSSGGNSGEVVRLCEKATQLSPHDAFYWADLGAAYERAGRNNDALQAFDRARELFPNSPEINWKAANFYVRTRHISDALAALQKVLPRITTPTLTEQDVANIDPADLVQLGGIFAGFLMPKAVRLRMESLTA